MGSRLFSNRYKYKLGRDRASRPKTFKTEEAAKQYAEANKIKKYEIKNLKSEASETKKLIIVAN
jgi:hypothetical protein